MSQLTKAHGPDPIAFMLSVDDNYSEHIKAFTGWMQSRGVKLSKATVIKYFEELNASGYAAATKQVKRSALKARLRQLSRAGGLGSTMSANMETFLRDVDREPHTKAPTRQLQPVDRSRYLTDLEYERTLEACRGPRQRAWIVFLYATGLRVSEATGIKLADCEEREDRVYLRIMGKGAKERSIYVPRSIYDYMRSTFHGSTYLLETNNGNRYRRETVSGQVAKVIRRATGKKHGAHALRHSFATRVIRKTGKVEAVSKWLGHSSPSITLQYYVHESLDDGDLFDGVSA